MRESAPLGDDFLYVSTVVLSGLSAASVSDIAVAGDARADRLILAGTYDEHLRLGKRSLLRAESDSGFLFRREFGEQILWAWSLPLDAQRTPTRVTALTVDADGNAIAAVSVAGQLPLPIPTIALNTTRSGPPRSLEISGAPGAALVSIASDGRLLWQIPVHSSRHLTITALAATSAPAPQSSPQSQDVSSARAKAISIVGSGAFTGTMRIGESVVSSAGFGDIFAFRLDGLGQVRWLRRAGGRGPDAGLAIAADGARIALAGTLTDEAQLGRFTVTARGRRTRSRRPRQDGFLALMNGAGEIERVVTLGGEGADSALATALGSDGRSYVAGRFARTLGEGDDALSGTDDGFVAAFEPTGERSVEMSFAVAIGGSGNNRAVAIANIADGLVVAGSFTDRASVGPYQLDSAGAHDIFAAKLTPTGRVTWARRFGGPDHDAVGALAVAVPDAANSDSDFGQSTELITLVGSFAGQADLGGPTPETAVGQRSGFALRFRL